MISSLVGSGVDFIYFLENFLNDFKITKIQFKSKRKQKEITYLSFQEYCYFFLDREARGLQLVKYASFAPLNSLSEKFKDNSGVYFHRRFTQFCNSFAHN